MQAKPIVDWDIDEATYVGEEGEGCYYQVGEKTWGPRRDRGWYVTVVVDTDQGAYCGDLATEQGPFETEAAAKSWGRNECIEWCVTNNVEYEHPLDEFSELMFTLKYRNTPEYERLMVDPAWARFMTMEEDALRDEEHRIDLLIELDDKLSYLRTFESSLDNQ